MAHNIQLLAIAGGILIGITFILFIVSNALNMWSEGENDDKRVTYGLWHYCIFVPDNMTCYNLPCPSEIGKNSFCNQIFAARAFLTLACMLSCISTIIWIIFCAVTTDTTPRLLHLANIGLTFTCLPMGIIGVGVGINATISVESDTKLRLGGAAIVGIVGIVINIFSAIVTVLVKR
ncbi:unnamed protein product [Rotaria sordida]|uniref:Uncharacterized protein n=1 Tax=Rotaria sordida TaxID=392033 RepID=A0A814G938_9BILA|nr:unnamed protein product [Rotaria sordida]